MPREPLVASAFTFKKATGKKVQSFIDKKFEKPLDAAKTREAAEAKEAARAERLEKKQAVKTAKKNIKAGVQKYEQAQANKAATEQKQKANAAFSNAQSNRSSGVTPVMKSYGGSGRVTSEQGPTDAPPKVSKGTRRVSSVGNITPPSTAESN